MRPPVRALLIATLLHGPTVLRAQTPQPAWMDRSLSVDRRAGLLNAALTLDERIALVHGIMAIPSGDARLPPGVPVTAGYVPGIPRLGIPALVESDASLGMANPGHRRADGATALPSGLALAATFDPGLAYAGGAAIGAEARARGFDVLLAGGVNLARNPWNGRNFEYLGEDPVLAGIMAGQSVRGIQSNGIIATVKHFVLNDQETHRARADAQIGAAALRESDLLAFEIAIGTGQPGAVMCAYNLVWGAHACGNKALLDGVLKGDWHYPGFVMSDWGAVDGVADALAGLDQESGEQLDAQVWFGAPLKHAVESGAVPAPRLADMTRRILRAMIAAGLLDRKTDVAAEGAQLAAAPRAADTILGAHLAVAQREAAAGIVLLRNENRVLPLGQDIRRILVVGGHADLGVLSGGGSSQVYPPGFDMRQRISLGGEGPIPEFRAMVFQGQSPVAALRSGAPWATISFDDGRYPAAAAARAREADAVIVFANQWMTEAEDAPDLSLPEGQDELIGSVCAANPRCVVVLQTGGAVAMPWLYRTQAVLEAWYSGEAGAPAIADVLLGKVDPSGRLPVTFPERARQYPRPGIVGRGIDGSQAIEEPHDEGADVGYRWFARTGQTPLFPFGYGLSYTSFRYANLRVQQGAAGMMASVEVSNTGTHKGQETVQLYLTRADGLKTLRLLEFAKVDVQPGETRIVTIAAEPRVLARFDTQANAWRRDAGAYEVAIGPSSTSLPLSAEVPLSAANLPP